MPPCAVVRICGVPILFVRHDGGGDTGVRTIFAFVRRKDEWEMIAIGCSLSGCVAHVARKAGQLRRAA
jgi:hypothetical protein